MVESKKTVVCSDISNILFKWSKSCDGSKEKESNSNILISSAAAAKSLQSCPTLCNPIDGSPSGSPTNLPLEILQARTLQWVAISFSSA